MITEDYVSLETAKFLKERGCNEICEYEYGVPKVDNGYVLQRFFKPIKNSELIDDAYTAPTLGMAMKWLREIHKISIVMAPSSFRLDTGNCSAWTYTIWYGYNIERHIEFDTYEEACEAAIKYCLENLI